MTDLLEAHTLLFLRCKAYGSYSPLLQRFHGEREPTLVFGDLFKEQWEWVTVVCKTFFVVWDQVMQPECNGSCSQSVMDHAARV
jgi:hypothetical protein